MILNSFLARLYSRNAVLNDTPEMGADAICYLTGERRDWLAGRYVSTNWDMAEFMSKKDEIIEKDLLKFKMRFE